MPMETDHRQALRRRYTFCSVLTQAQLRTDALLRLADTTEPITKDRLQPEQDLHQAHERIRYLHRQISSLQVIIKKRQASRAARPLAAP